jgi:MbtH protein
MRPVSTLSSPNHLDANVFAASSFGRMCSRRAGHRSFLKRWTAVNHTWMSITDRLQCSLAIAREKARDIGATLMPDQVENFLVVRNEAHQYSIWVADTRIPSGWTVVSGPADREVCLSWIEEIWTDLAPQPTSASET